MIDERVVVEDVPQRSRFEIKVDGAPVGFADYRRDGDIVSMPHTVIDPRFRGRRLGEVLAAAALESLKAEGLSVLPHCWFVRDVIAGQPADVPGDGAGRTARRVRPALTSNAITIGRLTLRPAALREAAGMIIVVAPDAAVFARGRRQLQRVPPRSPWRRPRRSRRGAGS